VALAHGLNLITPLSSPSPPARSQQLVVIAIFLASICMEDAASPKPLAQLWFALSTKTCVVNMQSKNIDFSQAKMTSQLVLQNLSPNANLICIAHKHLACTSFCKASMNATADSFKKCFFPAQTTTPNGSKH